MKKLLNKLKPIVISSLIVCGTLAHAGQNAQVPVNTFAADSMLMQQDTLSQDELENIKGGIVGLGALSLNQFKVLLAGAIGVGVGGLVSQYSLPVPKNVAGLATATLDALVCKGLIGATFGGGLRQSVLSAARAQDAELGLGDFAVVLSYSTLAALGQGYCTTGVYTLGNWAELKSTPVVRSVNNMVGQQEKNFGGTSRRLLSTNKTDDDLLFGIDYVTRQVNAVARSYSSQYFIPQSELMQVRVELLRRMNNLAIDIRLHVSWFQTTTTGMASALFYEAKEGSEYLRYGQLYIPLQLSY